MREPLLQEQQKLEGTLRAPWTDFIAAFMAVRSLHELLRNRPELATTQTVSVLAALFVNPRLIGERQGLFLFREAAGALLALFVEAGSSRGEDAIEVLYGVLRHGSGAPQRAVCETLAGLPVAISVPVVPVLTEEGAGPLLNWQDLPGVSAVGDGAAFVGRSLVAPLAEGSGLLVVKFARSDDELPALVGEAQWLSWLRERDKLFPPSMTLPRPLAPQGSFLFRLAELPATQPPQLLLHRRRYAIAFVAPADYYSYLNEPGNNLTEDDLVQVLASCAESLGKLAGMGVLHDALIPLFHNRLQRDRREDGGYYDWVLGGRLDRWLDSCQHPNLGSSGLRDFEHLITIDGRHGNLYRQLGRQFLSMLLVAASYFRNKQSSLRGHAPDGTPVDARHLFDAQVLRRAVEEMYRAYYNGFTGLADAPRIPFDLDRLVGRMIEEMGVDFHMAEVLRRVDQEQMSEREFEDFLTARGLSPYLRAGYRRGEADIELVSGPHLGGFNQAISLPELVEAVGGMAAMCVLGRYQVENGGGDTLAETSLQAGNG